MSLESQQPVDESGTDFTPLVIYSAIVEFVNKLLKDMDKIPNWIEHLKMVLECPAQLCIFESKESIDAFVKIDNYQTILEILYNIISGSKKDNSLSVTSIEGINRKTIEGCLDSMPINESKKLNEDWLDSVIGSNESKIEYHGNNLWNKLIPPNIKETLESELQSDNDKIKDVWIFCEKEHIDYPWEGIHWGNFYWGDRFRIVRIPEGRIPENCKSDNQNIHIKKIAVITDEDCNCKYSDMEYFKKLPEKNKEIISLQKEEDLNKLDLKGVDCIHVVASIDTIEKKGDLRDLFEVAFNKLDIKPTFLFLNIRRTGPIRDARDYINLPDFKNIFIRAVDIWIDTSFGLLDDISPGFAKEFYEALERCKKNQKNVAEVATEAREKMDCKRFCRLAHMVFGNPCNTVSWDVS